MNKILKSWAVFEAARGCVEMKQMIVLFICLLLAAGFVSAYELNGWTYEYEVENAHTKSESIHGKLMCRGREMPKQYEHVITPLGEFIFADVSGFNTVEKIRWTPCGLLPGYSPGRIAFARTEKDVRDLLGGDVPGFRKTPIKETGSVISRDPYLKGTFENPPKGVASDWFYVIKQGVWVNPARMEEAEKAFSTK